MAYLFKSRQPVEAKLVTRGQEGRASAQPSGHVPGTGTGGCQIEICDVRVGLSGLCAVPL